MTKVIIAGIGQTAVGEHWQISLRYLARQAIEAAIQDSGGLNPQALFVGNMLSPNLSKQAHLGAMLADFSGLKGIEACTIEAGSASGGAALRQGYLAVASGMVKVALVVGVEKFTDVVGLGVEDALATTVDSDFEAMHGMTTNAQAALLMRRYMHTFNILTDGFAGFAITAHANGAGNPNAMFRKTIDLQTYLDAQISCEPMNIFDVAPNVDGAAALILTTDDMLPPSFPHPLISIAASVTATDTLALHDRADPLWFTAVQISVEQALKKAGVDRSQINLYEYHDSFSIFADLSLEAAGFAPRGAGWKMAQDGTISLKGKIPCATMGGLKARGNPGGATGVYQAVEAVTQLRCQAAANQIADVRIAMIQSLGGPASIAVTHILTVENKK